MARKVQNTANVHNEKIKKGYQKSLICSVYVQRVKLWSKVDEDKHCKGSYIIGNIKNTQKSKKNLDYNIAAASNPTYTNIKESEKGCKRKQKEKEYEQKCKKLLRNSGLIYSPYEACPTKKVNQARSLGEPCQNCRLHCTENVSTEERENLFHLYWELADIDKQRQFIINTVTCETPARHRPRKETSSTNDRKQPIKYFLEKTQVCETMFLNTFNISQKVIRTAIAKKKKKMEILLLVI